MMRGRSCRLLWLSPLVSLGFGLSLAGCGVAANPNDGTPELTVFAAASTTQAVEYAASSHEGAQVRCSFASSSGLARQIRDGAPADVFLSASLQWVSFLEVAGALDGEPLVLARNRLVCIGRPGSWDLADPPRSVEDLLGSLASGDRVAIADEGVPAGAYARQSLRAQGCWSRLAASAVGQDDVRSVLRAVESGQAVAGFVYATDARVGDVDVLFELDPATHEPIEVFAAVVRSSRDIEQARRFLEHLCSDRVREEWAALGFEDPRP